MYFIFNIVLEIEYIIAQININILILLFLVIPNK